MFIALSIPYWYHTSTFKNMNSDNTTSVTCSVIVEHLNQVNNETIRKSTYKNATISLYRNEFREIVLGVIGNKNSKAPMLKKTIRDVKIHCKFLKEGKITVHLPNHSVRIMMSNCPPDVLKNFCKLLSTKVLRQKASETVSDKQRLAGLKKSLEEISPLNEKDIKAVQVATDKKLSQGKENKPLKTLNRKRKLPISNENEKESSKTASKRKQISLSTITLNKEQKTVLAAIERKQNIFFTGSAGTGKSYLLRYIVGMLPPSHTFVTASTGVSACQINGMTLHSFAGIGRGTGPVKEIIQSMSKKSGVVKQWKQCRHLIIDEISMIDAEMFDKLDVIARVLRQNNDPFGGIQLILCGDFFQLPPVSKNGQDKKKLCFQSKAWKHCIDLCVELRQIYRQKDASFVRLLQEIRIGRCTPSTTAILESTANNKLDKNGIIATRLCTHRDDVDFTNKTKIEKLSGEYVKFKSLDNSEAYSTWLDQALPDTKLLRLKLGAQVMLTKNIDVGNGLVNGARGVITGFKTASGSLAVTTQQRAQAAAPIVKFLSGLEMAITPERWSLKIAQDCMAIRRQIPLKLAWAVSIHKSQGMTLDCVEMTLSRVFECGQAYVALSRASSLTGLRVMDFTSSCVRSNVDALRFYRKLREDQIQEKQTLNIR